MSHAVIPDQMTTLFDLCQQIRVSQSPLAYYEKYRLNLILIEELQNLLCIHGVWPIIEGERHAW